MVEHGLSLSALLKVPAIILAIALAYNLVRGRRWAFSLSVVLLSISVLLSGVSGLYIGLTSSLYPIWKVLSLLIMAVICLISLISLLTMNRETT